MCYSAQTIEAYRTFERKHNTGMSLEEFAELFGHERIKRRIKVPKAMELAFSEPRNDAERAIKAMIDQHHVEQAAAWEEELFEQRKRLADAERALESKTTKAATESKRIAGDKVKKLKGWLADLHRTELLPRDARIFPGWYAPVIVSEGGRRVLKPMRYQCRPAGKPAFYDVKYPGTYNARRDNLEGFWRGQFGHTHGIMIVSTFFENVDRDGKNVVLQFTPADGQEMLVACLWSHWTGKDEPDLLSFAAITDEPPPEVAAAGHDRCIVQIKPEHVDAWLNPDPANLAALYKILDDRPRPYYEHRLAA